MNIQTRDENLGGVSKAVWKNKFRYGSFILYRIKDPVGTRGDKNRSLALPCMSYEAIKWGNLFTVVCDLCRWRRGSWLLRSSVAGNNATEVTNTPLWPNIHLNGRSSMARLDQSASHAELIISVCPSIDV